MLFSFILYAQKSNTFTDLRDGQIYKIVKIENQDWLAENLYYITPNGSWCYEDIKSNCEKFGALYNWETAKTVYPTGWRLPTYDDFEILLNNVSSSENNLYDALLDGGILKFNALPVGLRKSDGRYVSIHTCGWWSLSSSNDGAWFLGFDELSEVIGLSHESKEFGLSVRCIRE